MTYSPVRNGAGRPLVVDRTGHVIGAGEYGAADVDQQPAKGLVEDGDLVVVERPSSGELDPSAEAAFARVAELNGSSSSVEASTDTPTPTRGRRQGAASTSEA